MTQEKKTPEPTPLTDTEREALREVLDRVMDVMTDSCHHCGRMPDADGDHTCLCPPSNSECLVHTVDPVVSREAIQDALFGVAGGGDRG